MNRTKINMLTTAAGLVFLGLTANIPAAESAGRAYLGFDAGLGLQQDLTFRDDAGNRAKASFNPGLRFDLAGGFQFNEAWGLEFQTGLIYNSVDNLSGAFLPDVGSSMDVMEIPLMVNVRYHLPLHGPFSAYVGAGVGGVETLFWLSTPGFSSEKSDLTFGYQGIVGVKY